MSSVRPPTVDEGRRPLAFVEVTASGGADSEATTAGDVPAAAPGGASVEPGWSLWGDLEG